MSVQKREEYYFGRIDWQKISHQEVKQLAKLIHFQIRNQSQFLTFPT